MKVNHWTLALAAAGVVSMGAVAQAEEATESVKTLISGTTISGYVSTSAIWRPGTGNNDGAAFGVGPGASGYEAFHGANKQDGFNVDVVDITISKALDESEWAAGYKAELWFGDDAVTYATQNLGGAEPIAIKQAYVALRAPVGNGIDFKLGAFDTIIGFEAANAPDNAHYTRSIAWTQEPTTHTGILASYRFSDLFAVTAGVGNGGNVINAKAHNAGVAGTQGAESTKEYFGGVELTAPDSWGFLSGSKLTAVVIDAPRVGTGVVRDQDRINIYAGAVLNTPVEAWKVGISYDYVSNPGDPAGLGHLSSYASIWSLRNSYAFSDKLKLHLRAEYATGSSGIYTLLAAAAAEAEKGEEFFALTATVDYSLWENVISRLEFRWDTALMGGSGSGAFSPDNPFGGAANGTTFPDEKNSFLIAANVIYKF